MPTPLEEFNESVKANAQEFRIKLHADQIERLTDYYSLVMKWNERLHLVAPCSPQEFSIRHVMESLLLLGHLPVNASIVDVGSGAGLPEIGRAHV